MKVDWIRKIRHRRAFPGKGRLMNWIGQMVARQTPVVRTEIEPGVWMTLDLRDRIQRWMWGGVYEPEIRQILQQMLKPGDIFVDIGAHIGYFTVLAASYVKEQGQVVAYEPDPINFQQLLANVRHFSWVTAAPVALSDTQGITPFFRSPKRGESGWGSLLPNKENREVIEIETRTLDSEIQRLAWHRLDLVKVDVEGAEFRVLRGAQQVLLDFRPVWIVEINPACLARDHQSPGSIESLFAGTGYRVYRLGRPKDPRMWTVVALPEEQVQWVEQTPELWALLRPGAGLG